MSPRITVIFFVFFGLFHTAQSQNMDLLWASKTGSTANDVAFSMATDSVGNVWTAGTFSGTVDFNPGSGTSNLTSSGGFDVFVQKLDSAGNYLWAKKIGGSSTDLGYAIVNDTSGNVYVTGVFNGTVDFNPGSGTFNLISNGSYDIFVLKLDASGNFVWARSMGGSASDFGYGISVDYLSNVYVTGTFTGTVDFDPGTSVANVVSNGSSDIFIQKLNVSGNLVWVKGVGGASVDKGQSITVDDLGNSYVTGLFSSTVDFDPGTGTTSLTSNGGYDIFIQKFNPSGNLVWAVSEGGVLADEGASITTDAIGNLYLTGYFGAAVDFDPGVSSYILGSNGSKDIFVQKLDTASNLDWVKSMGGTGSDEGNNVSVDSDGNVYSTGIFQDTVDFNPGGLVFDLSSNGSSDVYVQKLDSLGNYDWAISMGGTSYDQGTVVSTNAQQNVYVAGSFKNTVDFNPTSAVYNITSNGNSDAFVIKLSQCMYYTTDVISACESYTWVNGVTYYSSNNTAEHQFITSLGCDSIVTLDLTINYADSIVDVISACNSYTWIDGITYTASNDTASEMFVNVLGCDSLVYLDLTINNSYNGTDIITACDSYTWIDGVTYIISNSTAMDTLTTASGCDSVLTLNLTINYSTPSADVITACNSYTWIDGNTYFISNNTATQLLSTVNGCDSLVTLDLTIDTVNANIDRQGFTLTAQAQNATFRWIDCENNTVLVGDTTSTFSVTQSGSYAVEVTQNGCVDTSACETYINVSVQSVSFTESIKVYPNPTLDFVTIDFGNLSGSTVLVTVFNYSGSKLVDKTIVLGTSQSQEQLDLSNFSSGIYFVKLNIEGQEYTYRITKM